MDSFESYSIYELHKKIEPSFVTFCLMGGFSNILIMTVVSNNILARTFRRKCYSTLYEKAIHDFEVNMISANIGNAGHSSH